MLMHYSKFCLIALAIIINYYFFYLHTRYTSPFQKNEKKKKKKEKKIFTRANINFINPRSLLANFLQNNTKSCPSWFVTWGT